MLIEIRDKASSWVAYIIIGLLILSFALWGIQEYFGGAAAAPIATINGKEISAQEFNNQFQQYRQRLQSILGNNYQQQYPDEIAIKKQVINDMVRAELLRQEASDAGFRISDASLINRIQQIPQFQKDGQFDPQQYERLLQVQRYSKAQFESELREQDKLRQFETSIVASSFLPKADLQRFQKLFEQSRDFNYALVKVDPDAVTVSADEIDQYYKENQQFYRTPEQVKLAYIELKEQGLQDQAQVTVDDVRAIYDTQPERYRTDELRKSSHILLKVPNEIPADSIEWDEAMDKANGLVQQLNKGAAFAELAKQHSEDSLSAEKGGEIGFIARGDFASTELEEALFSLTVGEHSKPIRTDQGIQIIKLAEIQAAEQKPFEEVREQIINERKAQLARNRFVEIAEELKNLVVEQPDDLLEPSETFGLQIKQTNWLTPTSTDEIFAFPEIQSLAFSDDILAGLNSNLIEVADGHVITFRLKEYKKPEQESIDKVSEDIKTLLAMRKTAEQATARGREIFALMQTGNSLEQLAKENSLELLGYGALRRDDNRVPNSIIERAFKLPHPVADKPLIDGVALADGSYALVELHKVIDGAEQLDDAKALQFSQRVNYGRREFSAVLEAIKEDADVQIHEDNL